ncbi:MAG: group 1 glycosyl transferase [Candidatus Saganbacteria bacterium]|uniref:Group 1 glycosyl transferase n=1 Tax=Candidatus Saganbacteria bacterium TaxID=2575572 RepID=A0A833NXM3_UNCSA|nr:MAG: group 1 glycosyl transferase [Candidatus Saganbacteria bacterium]
MRILILSESFPPETKSASTLFFELAESLVKNGYSVNVITRMPRYNIASGINLENIPNEEIISGVKVTRKNILPLARNIPIIRGFEHFLLAIIFFWAGLFQEKFDLILVYSPPLPLGIAGYWLSKIKKCPVIVNIQDLYPQTVIDLGLLKNKLLIVISRQMESFIYRNSNALTVHSEGNKGYLVKIGANEEKVRVIDNWVDTSLIQPGSKINDFSRKYGLDGKFIVSFAGVMGFAQGLEVVIQAADRLKDKKDIIFVLVGDGVKRLELVKMSESLGLKNVQFIPTQLRSIYPQVLNTSDICLVVLGQNLATPVVPGKMLSIMAAGKAILASMPENGDAPKIINSNNCGIVVPPDDSESLAQAVLKLYNNKTLCEQMGVNGRKAAVRDFSRNSGVDKYEILFNRIIKEKA